MVDSVDGFTKQACRGKNFEFVANRIEPRAIRDGIRDQHTLKNRIGQTLNRWANKHCMGGRRPNSGGTTLSAEACSFGQGPSG